MTYRCKADAHFTSRRSLDKTIARLLDMKSKPFEVAARFQHDQRIGRGWVITGEYNELVEATRPVGIKTVEGSGGVMPTDARSSKRRRPRKKGVESLSHSC